MRQPQFVPGRDGNFVASNIQSNKRESLPMAQPGAPPVGLPPVPAFGFPPMGQAPNFMPQIQSLPPVPPFPQMNPYSLPGVDGVPFFGGPNLLANPPSLGSTMADPSPFILAVGMLVPPIPLPPKFQEALSEIGNPALS